MVMVMDIGSTTVIISDCLSNVNVKRKVLLYDFVLLSLIAFSMYQTCFYVGWMCE